MNKPNMRKLTGCPYRYVVRTQAGFKQAIKDWIDEDYYLERAGSFNYPKSYPSIVYFYTFYQGYDGYNCTCTPLTEYREYLRKQLEDLEDE